MIMLDIFRKALFVPYWFLFVATTCFAILVVMGMLKASVSHTVIATDVSCAVKDKAISSDKIQILIDCAGHPSYISDTNMVYDILSKGSTTIKCKTLYEDGGTSGCV
jgi:hypothetical protein